MLRNERGQNTGFPNEPVDDGASSMDRARLAAIAAKFRRLHAQGGFPGGQLVVRREGRVELNVAVGVARGFRADEGGARVEVEPTTPFPVFSCGKPLAGLAVAMLEDRGLVDVEAPIARYVPEFERHGRGDITTLDVLTHRAGLVVPAVYDNLDRWSDRAYMLQQLLTAKSRFPRGTFAYHPNEYGCVLSELVERVAGQPLPEFVAREIAEPLGLPALRYGLAGRSPAAAARTYWLGGKRVMVAGANVAENAEEKYNAPAFFESMNPAISMIADAGTLAAFYEALVAGGVARDGRRLLSEGRVRTYTTRCVSGWNHSLRTGLTYGRGFMVGSRLPSSFGLWDTGTCFGHGGLFSSLAFGDRRTGVAAAIVTNGNRGLIDLAKLTMPIAGAIRRACPRG
jgi:CubicO group peptidase (beta-lactamase class C family)